jgi:hypothetical protein
MPLWLRCHGGFADMLLLLSGPVLTSEGNVQWRYFCSNLALALVLAANLAVGEMC